MLFRSPPVNLPLITLPFFSSNESAIAAVTTRHITKTNRNICIRFILFVLCSAMTYLHNQWALWMIALAGDFYVFAPRLTARLAAVLLAVRNVAAAWDVRAFLVLLVSHGNSSDRCCSGFLIPRQARRHVYLLKMADEVGTGHSPQP